MKFISFLSILFLFSYPIQSQNSEIVAWDEVEKTPVFVGCSESGNISMCSKKAFIDFVINQFNHELISGSESAYTLNFRIIIGTDGKLRWSSVKGNNDELELEGRRILSSLPAYSPGLVNNQPVNVMVSYRIELEKQNEISNIKSVDIPPIPRNCENNDDKRTCLSENISRYVNRSFNTDILRSKKKGNSIFRTTVHFVINEQGKTVNVTADGENEVFNQEAIRVVSTIPSMQPAILNDKPVAVTYSLPVVVGISNI
ncbi:energy transducer TonB [uncultured Christiangramia sp.]|uniref:energy transducer TonB n=1 Tax=Christiangramia sp. 3-2217-3z TaxID=3417564 RepID=UPI00262519DA|nr:energy transducer TonB [uncultured Christiangramia sp.]